MEYCGGNKQGLLTCACRGGVEGMVRGGGGCRAREMAVVAGSARGDAETGAGRSDDRRR
jgi:hypothetical protein